VVNDASRWPPSFTVEGNTPESDRDLRETRATGFTVFPHTAITLPGYPPAIASDHYRQTTRTQANTTRPR